MRSLRPSIDRVASVNIDDITSKESNRDILRRLRCNEIRDFSVFESLTQDPSNEYYPEGGSDFGWIGYFIGQSMGVKAFEVCCDDKYADGNEHFFRGLGHNKSILNAYFGRIHIDASNAGVVKSLSTFLENNNNLVELELYDCDLGAIGWCSLALALATSSRKSLERVKLNGNQIQDEQLVDLISALRNIPGRIHVENMEVGINGAVALANSKTTFGGRVIYQGDVAALAERLSSICNVEELFISDATADRVDVTIGWNDKDYGWCLRHFSCQLCGRDDISRSLRTLFETSHNLVRVVTKGCHFGDDGWRSLATAVGASTSTSLKSIRFNNNTIHERLADIVLALSMHPQLEDVSFTGMAMGVKGCIAMETWIRNTAKSLRFFDLSESTLSGEGLEALANALATHTCLRTLRLPAITRGYEALATLLQSQQSNLKTLGVGWDDVVDEDQVATFMRALANNQTLTHLEMSLPEWHSRALSQALCDTASVNQTFCSNHTLANVWALSSMGEDVSYYLNLNSNQDKHQVAITKILKNHAVLDMRPFFEWDLKVLPLAVNWFDKASRIQLTFDARLEQRKLSAVYQFIRAMPMVCVEGVSTA